MGAHRRNIRKLCLTGTAMAGALGLMATPAYAQEQTFELDVPSQRLDAALRAFAQQSRQQLMFAVADTKGFNAPALNGSYTADQAIGTLLAGTGLEVHRNASGVFLIASASDPQSGSAAGDGAGTVEALIVTAQKREENIQDVPIAMSAFTQEDLTRSQVAGGPDLMTQVPNMTFTKTNFSSYSIQLRGIGTQAISATTDAAVAVAFNNTPFIRNHFFEQEFYDLERVEVLRGPQGTLYGRNATAGVVNVISAKPKFRAEAKAAADVSNYNSTRVEGMVNIPLVDDKVALRLAGAWTKRDGYVTNQISGNPIDGRDLWSTRLSLRFAPTDAIDVNLIWEHFEENDDRLRSGKQLCKTHTVTSVGAIPLPTQDTDWRNPGNSIPFSRAAGIFSQGCSPASLYSPESFGTPNGLSLPYYLPLGALSLPTALDNPYANVTQSHDLRVIESTVDPDYRARSDLGELQINLDIAEGLTLTSETAYNADALFSLEDYNRFNTAPGAWRIPLSMRPGVLTPDPDGPIFCDPQLGCTNRMVAVDVSQAKSHQFSEEVRIGSDFDGPFNFSLGANYLRLDNEDKYYVFINSLSLIAASYTGKLNGHAPVSPYVNGVTDNADCQPYGLVYPDPNVVQPVGNTRCVYIDPNPIGALNDDGHNYFLSRNPYKLISYAVFGEAYYNLTDNLKVTAGLRWTVDRKQAPRLPSWVLAGESIGYPVTEVVNQEWREPTGRLAIDWKPDLGFTDATLVYASYAHGYKAGGANPPPAGPVMYGGALGGDSGLAAVRLSATHPKTFEPEFIDAFELGTKNTLADGALTLNLAAFYYDYTGYQISQIVNRSAVNLNFDAQIWGLEIEADWRPVENFHLGFKGGYENTRVADGMKAVDLMDRTGGHDDWLVVRPFPTFSANCILPLSLFERPGGLYNVGNMGGGGDGPCELAYLRNLDPITEQPYNANTLITDRGFTVQNPYTGFNPETAPNHGEGFDKDLSGNELPNAPHFTATITADYTLPLPNDWLMTLHSDLYWQSEAWTRIFNLEGYDKLKAYTNLNLAAIFANEESGWTVMAYAKNVMDRDSITGAFLNSDDTGLTTNIFLTEPRLYGVRITKAWSDAPLLGGLAGRREGPYALTVELGGQVQRHDAPYETLGGFGGVFPARLDPTSIQNDDLDWGDGRDVTVTWRPASGPWTVSAAVRFGRTNGSGRITQADPAGKFCLVAAATCAAATPAQKRNFYLLERDYVHATSVDREDHQLADFAIGRDVGFGGLRSSFQAGVRYAELTSTTRFEAAGIPDWQIPLQNAALVPIKHHRYTGEFDADRSFKGAGPMLAWEASQPLIGDDGTGRVSLDWSLGAGVLFGKQKTEVQGRETASYYSQRKYNDHLDNPPTTGPITTTVAQQRTKSVTVPTLDLELGLSYTVGRMKVGGGYRWERYFDAVDAGVAQHEDADRTIDGPYFKLAIGFGG